MVGKAFFEKDHCDRCTGDLTVRTTSWFNQETICHNCSMWEEVIISRIPESKSEIEAVGHIPEISAEINWGTKPPEDLKTE